jgi:hypothetical protein
MKPADVLAKARREWRQYQTEPSAQGGQGHTYGSAPTIPGTPLAATLRERPHFLREVAHHIGLLLEETERNRRGIDALREQGPAPVPLVLPGDVEADLRHQYAEVESLRMELTGEGGVVERLVRVEYLSAQDPHRGEAWITGLAVCAAAFSGGCLLVCLTAALWVMTEVDGLRSHAEGSTAGVVAPIRLAAPADEASQVRGAVGRKRERTGREGP